MSSVLAVSAIDGKELMRSENRDKEQQKQVKQRNRRVDAIYSTQESFSYAQMIFLGIRRVF